MPAIQRPTAVGLTLCRLVIVEERTQNVTLANSFLRLEVDSFPSSPIPFVAYTHLTDGLGTITLDLIVSRCDTLEEVYTRSLKTTFKNPLKQLRLCWQIHSCSFPVAGAYQFGLQADGELITQSILKVTQKGASHA